MLNCSTLVKPEVAVCMCVILYFSFIFSLSFFPFRFCRLYATMIIVCAFGGTFILSDRAWWHTLLFKTVASYSHNSQLNIAIVVATSSSSAELYFFIVPMQTHTFVIEIFVSTLSANEPALLLFANEKEPIEKYIAQHNTRLFMITSIYFHFECFSFRKLSKASHESHRHPVHAKLKRCHVCQLYFV